MFIELRVFPKCLRKRVRVRCGCVHIEPTFSTEASLETLVVVFDQRVVNSFQVFKKIEKTEPLSCTIHM